MRLAQENVRNEIGKSGSANANEWKGMEEIRHLKGGGRKIGEMGRWVTKEGKGPKVRGKR